MIVLPQKSEKSLVCRPLIWALLASQVLAGVVELLAAAGPDARVSPRGVGSLLAPALEEVREAERELRMTV